MVFCVLVIGAVIGQSAMGDPASKIAQKQDELSRIQSNSGSLESQIDSMNQRVDQLIGEESRLRQAQAAAQAQLDQKQAELDKATAELNAQKAELARVRAKLQDATGALEQLLVEMYKSSDPDLTSVMLRSASWSDLLTRKEYVDHIRSYDDAVVARVRGLRDQITALVNQLQATHDRIKAARDAVAEKEREIASQHAQIQQQQSELASARDARESVLNALLRKERQIQTDLSNIPAPAGRATLDSSGDAIPPSNAPLAVRAVIEAQPDRRPPLRVGRGTWIVHLERLRLLGRRQLRAPRWWIPVEPARLHRSRGLGRARRRKLDHGLRHQRSHLGVHRGVALGHRRPGRGQRPALEHRDAR